MRPSPVRGRKLFPDVDFSGGIVYDKNGSVGTRGRKVNHVRGCCAAGTAKAGKRPGASLKETGRKNPTRTALWAQECTEAALAAGTKVRHWGQAPEKVGCKRGAIGSTARGRRIARRRTFSAAGVFFVGRRQDPCAAGVSFFRGWTGGFCTGCVSAFPPPQTHFVDLPETAGHKFFTGGKCI